MGAGNRAPGPEAGGGVGEGDVGDDLARRMATDPDFRAAVAELVQRVPPHDLRDPDVRAAFASYAADPVAFLGRLRWALGLTEVSDDAETK